MQTPHLHITSAPGKTVQRSIEVLIAGSRTADRTILSEDIAAHFGLAVTIMPLADLDRQLPALQPDVLLIDAVGPRNNLVILQLLRKLRKNSPLIKCVLLLDEDETEFQVQAFQSGIHGIVQETNHTGLILGNCICCVHNGYFWISSEALEHVLDGFSQMSLPSQEPMHNALSPREQQVMDLVIQGLSNRAIAEVLRVTESTVKKYVYEVFNKTGASNRVELVLRALRSNRAA